MQSERIRCPRKHCPDPDAGWRQLKAHGEFLNEYACYGCEKHFFYNAQSRELYDGLANLSSLKYFPFADDFNKNAQTLSDSLKGIKGLRKMRSAKYADLIIVFGGDGTMLKAVHKYAAFRKPFIGFYFHPSRGFLSNPESRFSTEVLMCERYEIFHAPLLAVRMKTVKGEIRMGIALNEMSIKGSALTQTVNLEVLVDGETLLDRLMADGLVVSTPIGSTGYAVPAGGSAILPSLSAFEIVPNNSSKPGHRTSQIVSDSSVVKVRAMDLPRRKIVVACDNDVYENVKEIEIRRADAPVKLAFIKPDNITWDQFFLARSREKIYG